MPRQKPKYHKNQQFGIDNSINSAVTTAQGDRSKGQCRSSILQGEHRYAGTRSSYSLHSRRNSPDRWRKAVFASLGCFEMCQSWGPLLRSCIVYITCRREILLFGHSRTSPSSGLLFSIFELACSRSLQLLGKKKKLHLSRDFVNNYYINYLKHCATFIH